MGYMPPIAMRSDTKDWVRYRRSHSLSFGGGSIPDKTEQREGKKEQCECGRGIRYRQSDERLPGVDGSDGILHRIGPGEIGVLGARPYQLQGKADRRAARFRDAGIGAGGSIRPVSHGRESAFVAEELNHSVWTYESDPIWSSILNRKRGKKRFEAKAIRLVCERTTQR